MDQWLEDEADACGIPDDERAAFIKAMRGTLAFQATRARVAWDAWLDQTRPQRILDWINRKFVDPTTPIPNGDR